MTTKLVITKAGSTNLEQTLFGHFAADGPTVIGIGVAYISNYGARFVQRLAEASHAVSAHVIFDTRDCVTHPNALRFLHQEGVHLRQANHAAGTFHPKYIVTGAAFAPDGQIVDARAFSVGSGNLSFNALRANTEASLLRRSDQPLAGASVAFSKLWGTGTDVDANDIDLYEHRFALRNRARSTSDQITLGVADRGGLATANEILAQAGPTQSQQAISPGAARAAWAGLQSFTGEYTLQVEFPQLAGSVLGRLIAGLGGGVDVPILCSDGSVRDMHYRFYDDNSMFRLNIPNDVPGVELARQTHEGIALIELMPSNPPVLRLSLLHDTDAVDDVVRRSEALGTWGRTRTRAYGWF